MLVVAMPCCIPCYRIVHIASAFSRAMYLLSHKWNLPPLRSMISLVFQAFVCRELGNDMDLSLYNKLITMQQQDKYAQYFAP